MKKDIFIPKVEHVYLAVVKEYNNEYECDDWVAYIINNKDTDLEMVLIVSEGFDKDTSAKTSVMRHKIDKLPAKSYAKVELLQEEVLKLSNSFNVSFFEGQQMYDKKFVFEKGTIKERYLRMIPLLNKKGVLKK